MSERASRFDEIARLFKGHELVAHSIWCAEDIEYIAKECNVSLTDDEVLEVLTCVHKYLENETCKLCHTLIKCEIARLKILEKE